MNPEVKKQWVEALRSGEYTQTESTLHDAAGFCCLGVLCDLHAKATDGQWNDRTPSKCKSYLGHYGLLPPVVVDWAGIETKHLHEQASGFNINFPDEHGHTQYLSTLNDSGQSFEEIAQIIDIKF